LKFDDAIAFFGLTGVGLAVFLVLFLERLEEKESESSSKRKVSVISEWKSMPLENIPFSPLQSVNQMGLKLYLLGGRKAGTTVLNELELSIVHLCDISKNPQINKPTFTNTVKFGPRLALPGKKIFLKIFIGF